MASKRLYREDKPVAPSHWRYLWDCRRNSAFSDYASPPDPSPPDQHPLSLPEDLILASAADVDDVATFLGEVHTLLDRFYVEDEDGIFRFSLTLPYLEWALLLPDVDLRCLLCVRSRASNEMVGFLAAMPFRVFHDSSSGEPTAISVDGEEGTEEDERIAWVDFVCVHGDHRGRRICPFLYGEVTRRLADLQGVTKLICTSGDHVPHPTSASTFYHRLNADSVERLVQCEFTSLAPRMTLERLVRLYRLPPPAVRVSPLVSPDVSFLRPTFNAYTRERHSVAKVFHSDEDMAHALLSRDGIVHTFVHRASTQREGGEESRGGGGDSGGLEAAPECNAEPPCAATNAETDVHATEGKDDGDYGEVTDFVSFFLNEATILTGDLAGEGVRGAYLYYSMVTTCDRVALLGAAMSAMLAKDPKIDHFACLHGPMGIDKATLRALKFGEGTGVLHYYMYNFEHEHVPPERIAWYTT